MEKLLPNSRAANAPNRQKFLGSGSCEPRPIPPRWSARTPSGTGASDHAHRRFCLETRVSKSFGRRCSAAQRHQSASTANDEHPFTLLRQKPCTLRYLMLSAGTLRRPSALWSVGSEVVFFVVVQRRGGM